MNATTTTTFVFSAAAMFLGACSKDAPATTAPGASAAQVKCMGINECKGQSLCGVPNGHACNGQNECKGKGYLRVSADECNEKGGTIL